MMCNTIGVPRRGESMGIDARTSGGSQTMRKACIYVHMKLHVDFYTKCKHNS